MALPCELRINAAIDADAFIALLQASTLAERRPVHDRECMEGMLRHANLTLSAWQGSRLVGISRAMTDFHYACYLTSSPSLAFGHRLRGKGGDSYGAQA